MQFLSVSRRRLDQFPAEAWTPELMDSEAQRVREMYAAGSLRTIWRRGDLPGAVMLLEAADEAEARALVESLPLAKLGMLEFVVVTALEPYPGFGPR
jgi:muconolactone delta-isomerase